jgi:23S rRNA-/tRNA-specific pseudouridylate synthase
VVKRYFAIAAGAQLPAAFESRARLEHRGRVVDPRAAHTRGRTLARWEPNGSLLELEPVTGRRHQLRLHCTQLGAPLLGDRAYGGATRIVEANGGVLSLDRIALHAFALDGPGLSVRSPLPDELVECLRRLGAEPPVLSLVVTA